MTYWKLTTFRELQTAWYKRLQDDGFRDQEHMVGDDLELRRDHAIDRTSQKESKEEYFTLLRYYAERSTFDNEIHYLILNLYAEGMKIQDICHELADKKSRPPFHAAHSRNRQSVRFIIRKYEVRWGLRQYDDKQLNKWNAYR